MHIGELADTLGINPRTIRFYEARGPLPEPERTASGYRSHSQEDVERITFIKTAQRIGSPGTGPRHDAWPLLARLLATGSARGTLASAPNRVHAVFPLPSLSSA